MQLTTHNLIAALKTALFAFRDKMGIEVPALHIETLALVVMEPGIEQKEAKRPLGVSATAAGRNIVDLGKRKKDGTTGPDFVEQRELKLPGRGAPRKVVYPTTKGLHWLERLAGEIATATGLPLDTLRLAVLLRVSMSLIRAATDPKIALYRMLILLCVLEKPGLGQTALGAAADIHVPAAVSRNVLNLTAFKTDKTPGPEFLEQRIDPLHRKENRIYATIKAQHWFETVVGQVNAALLKTRPK